MTWDSRNAWIYSQVSEVTSIFFLRDAVHALKNEMDTLIDHLENDRFTLVLQSIVDLEPILDSFGDGHSETDLLRKAITAHLAAVTKSQAVIR